MSWRAAISFQDKLIRRSKQWNKINAILQILERGTYEAELAEALKPYSVSLQPAFVCEVLHSTRNVRAATGFFGWAGQQRNYRHNAQAYAALIDILCKAKDINGISYYVEEMEKEGIIADAKLYCKLVEIYGRLGMLQEAESTFDHMRRLKQQPSLLAYTVLIHQLVKVNHIKRAEDVFEDMLSIGCSADHVLYSVLMDGYGRLGRLEDVMRILREMVETGLSPDKIAYTTLINSFCDAGKVEEAEWFVKAAVEHNVGLDAALLNAFLGGLCRTSKFKKAAQLVETMENSDVRPNERTYNILLYWLCKTGNLEEALKIMDSMEKKGCQPNTTSFTILVDYYSGRIDAASQMFEKQVKSTFSPANVTIENFVKGAHLIEAETVVEMIDKVCKASVVTYGTLINWLCRSNKLDEALAFSSKVTQKGFHWNVIIYNTLITHLCKAGRLEDAKVLLTNMWDSGCNPNVKTFTTYMQGLCEDRELAELFEVLELMIERCIVPDDVMYSAVVRTLIRSRLLNTCRAMIMEKLKAGERRFVGVYHKLLIQIDNMASATKEKPEV
ncbi:hypothetical protein KP509_09G082800 [Ceratopteris richardii]|uniref:Pentatricopeptide repeat-containing protein n=1 Tax=Ceratopteris richardii TaxID=49495 RepID=A0A8T2U2V0_CERRI|nr:hypothetical protein KP509_09G082800 [Ceratopteris richardii]